MFEIICAVVSITMITPVAAFVFSLTSQKRYERFSAVLDRLVR